MYNIKALEEEWKRYNRKKKRPLIFLLVVIVLVAATLVIVLNTDIIERYKYSRKEGISHKTTEQTQKVYIDMALHEPEKKESVQSIDAPMDIGEDGMNVGGVSPSEDLLSKHVKKKIHIEVIDAGSKKNSLKEVEKRFRLAPDTDDSLFLARSYYKKRNYKKTEYWALQTNKLNDNIEESWLLFAKAKVKRGHRNEAIRILNAYVKRTNSAEAKVLLSKIKKGRL